MSETGRGEEGKCKDLTGNQTINLLRVEKNTFLLPSDRACLQMTLQAGDSRALSHQASKSGGTTAPSPGRAEGKHKCPAQAQRAACPHCLTHSSTHFQGCFPQAQGDVLNASLAGAVPLPGHLLVESRWEREQNELKKAVSRTTVPGRRSSGFSQGFKGF